MADPREKQSLDSGTTSGSDGNTIVNSSRADTGALNIKEIEDILKERGAGTEGSLRGVEGDGNQHVYVPGITPMIIPDSQDHQGNNYKDLGTFIPDDLTPSDDIQTTIDQGERLFGGLVKWKKALRIREPQSDPNEGSRKRIEAGLICISGNSDSAEIHASNIKEIEDILKERGARAEGNEQQDVFIPGITPSIIPESQDSQGSEYKDLGMFLPDDLTPSDDIQTTIDQGERLYKGLVQWKKSLRIRERRGDQNEETRNPIEAELSDISKNSNCGTTAAALRASNSKEIEDILKERGARTEGTVCGMQDNGHQQMFVPGITPSIIPESQDHQGSHYMDLGTFIPEDLKPSDDIQHTIEQGEKLLGALVKWKKSMRMQEPSTPQPDDLDIYIPGIPTMGSEQVSHPQLITTPAGTVPGMQRTSLLGAERGTPSSAVQAPATDTIIAESTGTAMQPPFGVPGTSGVQSVPVEKPSSRLSFDPPSRSFDVRPVRPEFDLESGIDDSGCGSARYDDMSETGSVFRGSTPVNPPAALRRNYDLYTDLLEDATYGLKPWIVLRNEDDFLALGLVSQNEEANVDVKVVFNGTFYPTIRKGDLVVKKTYDVQCQGLRDLLDDLEKTSWCPGSEPRSESCTVAVDAPGFCQYCSTANIPPTKVATTDSTHYVPTRPPKPARLPKISRAMSTQPMHSLLLKVDSDQSRLTKYRVPPTELEYGEYVYDIIVTKQSAMDDLFKLISALLNTSGGIIRILTGDSLSGKKYDKWQCNLRDRMNNFMTRDVYLLCIHLHVEQDCLYMQVHKSKVFITTQSFMYVRGIGPETLPVRYDQSIALILNNEIIKDQDTIFPRTGRYEYMAVCPNEENQRLEFKCFNCHSTSDLIERLKQSRTLKTFLSMANISGGGEVILGINDSAVGNQIIGQDIGVADECEFVVGIENMFLQEEGRGTKRIWGDPTVVPKRGTHWDCDFLPVGTPPYICRPRCRSCPHKKQKTLICIRIFQCPGCVFEQRPESYKVNDNGEIIDIPFNEWRSHHMQRSPEALASTGKTVRLDQTGTTLSYQNKEKSPAAHLTASQPIPQQAAPGANQEPSTTYTAGIESQNEGFGYPGDTLSFKTHSSRFDIKNTAPDNFSRHLHSSAMFRPEKPVHYTPGRDQLADYLPEGSVLDMIDEEMDGHPAFGIADTTMYNCIEHSITAESLTSSALTHERASLKPLDHIMDLFVVNDIAQIFLFVICSSILGARKKYLMAYAMVLARLLKKKLLHHMPTTADYTSDNIRCKIIGLDSSQYESPDYYRRWFPSLRSTYDFDSICSSVGQMLLKVQTHFRSAVHFGADVNLSSDQISVLHLIGTSRFGIVHGPPGCGKTLLARHICQRVGKDNSAYISASRALNNFIAASGAVNVFYAASAEHILSLLHHKLEGSRHIIIDDNQNYNYTASQLEKICENIARNDKHLYIFEDSAYQNYRATDSASFLQIIAAGKYGSMAYKRLTEIRRNAIVVASFLKAQVAALESTHDQISPDIKSSSAVEGDDIIIKMVRNLRAKTEDNGLLLHVRQMISTSLSARERRYTTRDVAVIVDHAEDDAAREEVRMFQELFEQFWPMSNPQGADVYPAQGVIIDTLNNFSGLESRAIVYVVPRATEAMPLYQSAKYRIAVASRGIERIEEDTLDRTTAEAMMCDAYLPTGLIQ